MAPQSHRRVLLIGAVAVLTLSVGATALFPESREEPMVPDGAYDRVFAGLCASSAAADDNELARAHGVFLGRAHTGLHLLASELADAGRRPLAGNLLEAKNAVEESLPARDASAPEDLRRLLRATADGIAAADQTERPTCPEETNP